MTHLEADLESFIRLVLPGEGSTYFLQAIAKYVLLTNYHLLGCQAGEQPVSSNRYRRCSSLGHMPTAPTISYIYLHYRPTTTPTPSSNTTTFLPLVHLSPLQAYYYHHSVRREASERE